MVTFMLEGTRVLLEAKVNAHCGKNFLRVLCSFHSFLNAKN